MGFTLKIQCDVLKIYIGTHRDQTAVQQRLQAGVEPALLDCVINQFVYGAQQQVHGYSSNDNFMEYIYYGNYSSCPIHSKKFREAC